jgi:hypothetical protein
MSKRVKPVLRIALKAPIVVFISNASCLVFCAAPLSMSTGSSVRRSAGNDRVLAIARDDHIQVNERAFLFAKELIDQGRIVADRRNAWGEHQPSAEEENEFIRQHGFAEYAEWHLGIDDRHAKNTKARYKFPFGDFKNIHRSALLAAKTRARQYAYGDIENAANRLLEMIDSKEKDHDGRAAERAPVQAVRNASISSGKSSL